MARYEWRRIWLRPFSWIFVAGIVALMALLFALRLQDFLNIQVRLAASASGIGYTDLMTLPWLALFGITASVLVPLLTMHTLAGERRAGTLALFFAAGVSPVGIVLGKYLATLAWLLLLLALILAMPLTLAPVTAPDWGKLAAAALGLMLLLGSLTAIGLACSAYTANMAAAAVATLLITAALWFINRSALNSGVIGGVANWLALPTHLQPMGVGIVSSADIAWFVIVILLALVLAIHRVGTERSRG